VHGPTERRERQRHLTLGIETDELIDASIDEAKEHLRGDSFRRGRRQQVGENRPVVPVAMSIGARLILPGVAPERRRRDQQSGRIDDAWIVGRGSRDGRTIVPIPQLA
jgi:hypothetical protein